MEPTQVKRNPIRKKDVEIGATYVAKVSGNLTTIRISGESQYGGWDAVNLRTGKPIRIRTAARLRARNFKESTNKLWIDPLPSCYPEGGPK